MVELVNMIRRSMGLMPIENVSDGLVGELTEKEIEMYLGAEGKRLYREHTDMLVEKYIMNEGYHEIQPVRVNRKGKGLLIRSSEEKYDKIGVSSYLVLLGKKYDLMRVSEKEIKKRIPLPGEIDNYNRYRDANDKCLKKIEISWSVGETIKEKYEYLGVETNRIKIVLRKKDNGEIMYYNPCEVELIN